MKPLIKSLILSAAIISISGCATIFTGTKQNVRIESVPPGAEILVDGVKKGNTPATVKLKKGYHGQMVTLKLDGHETFSILPETSFNYATVLNLFNFLPWSIDAATGAMWEYDFGFFEISLEPVKIDTKSNL